MRDHSGLADTMSSYSAHPPRLPTFSFSASHFRHKTDRQFILGSGVHAVHNMCYRSS